MGKFYADETNVLILVALLKAHGIKRVIASPGTTNLSFVASLQCDPFFEIYSCVDERSAAYMACGLAAETGEAVVITCTGATASRNYMSALTEAYYRKLPILVVTGTQSRERIGNLAAQVINRNTPPEDVQKMSVYINPVNSGTDAEYCQLKINRAINELFHRGGGPVHINLETTYTRNFNIKELPKVKVIKRFTYKDAAFFPEIPNGRIGVFVGSHKDFSDKEQSAIEKFCSSRNAVVFCDHTSGYHGKYKVNMSLAAVQENKIYDTLDLDLCIHIGEISGEYGCITNLKKKEVWRVSEDGEIRDSFRKLHYVFEMAEADFFNYYSLEGEGDDSFLDECNNIYENLLNNIKDLPFSNVWIASQITPKLPENCILHLGILNSLRTWNLFKLPTGVRSYSNVGGFGIDGGVSTLIGASLANTHKLYIGVVGDLAFFYDMNSLGNRHINSNIRLLVVNNGKGTEFRNFYHTGSQFGDDADKYIAAGGHFGNKSRQLVKHYAEDLGYDYISANNKEEFLQNYEKFLIPQITEKPIVFEVFTQNEDESDALHRMWNIEHSSTGVAKKKINDFVKLIYKNHQAGTVKKIIGKRGIVFFKKILGV